MGWNNYPMVVGMQKKKLENLQDDFYDLKKENEIMRRKLLELSVDVEKLLGKEIIVKNDLFDCDKMYKELLIDFNSNSTSNLSTLERYSKKNDRIENLDFFVNYLLKKYVDIKDVDEKIFILRAINKSLNFYVTEENIVIYSNYLLEMLISNGYRYTIVLCFSSLWEEIFKRIDGVYPNQYEDDLLKRNNIKFNQIIILLYTNLVGEIYCKLIRLYQTNKGNIKRSVGIAIERCNFEKFQEIINKTDKKKLYETWNKMSLYNKEKWSK